MSESERRLRVLVVDDEPPARDRLESLVAGRDDAVVVGSAADGDEALAAIRELQPDLVFLDVKMPGRSGLDVVRALPRGRMPAVVMVTAFDEYAVEAFEVAALDYLVKPFDDERFARAFERARERLRERNFDEVRARLLEVLEGRAGTAKGSVSAGTGDEEPTDEKTAEEAPARPLERIGIDSGGRVRVVAVDDLDYLTADGNYVELHVGGETHLVRESLTRLAKRLPRTRFCRIHRGTVVNVARVEAVSRLDYGDARAELRDGTVLRVSRTYRSDLAEALGIEL